MFILFLYAITVVYYLSFILLDFVSKYYVWKSENFWTPTFTPFILKYYNRPIDQNFGNNEKRCNVCKKFKFGGMFDFYCIFISKEKPRWSTFCIITLHCTCQKLKIQNPTFCFTRNQDHQGCLNQLELKWYFLWPSLLYIFFELVEFKLHSSYFTYYFNLVQVSASGKSSIISQRYINRINDLQTIKF